jgi:hypothetical protein
MHAFQNILTLTVMCIWHLVHEKLRSREPCSRVIVDVLGSRLSVLGNNICLFVHFPISKLKGKIVGRLFFHASTSYHVKVQHATACAGVYSMFGLVHVAEPSSPADSVSSVV